MTRKLKPRYPHALVFHMQSYWWVWFPGIEPRILEPTNISAEGSEAKWRTFAPAKITHYTEDSAYVKKAFLLFRCALVDGTQSSETD